VRVEKDRVSLATHRVAPTPREEALMEQIEARYSSSGTTRPSSTT